MEYSLGTVLEWEKLWSDQWPRQAYEFSEDWERIFGKSMRLFVKDHVPELGLFEGEERDVVDHIIECWQLALAATRRHFSIPPSMPEALANAEIWPVLEQSSGVQEPGRKPDAESISVPVTTSKSEDLEREKTAKTETKEFDPRDLGKGERGKLIGIAVSGKRSGFTLPQIASAMQKTGVVCPSKKGYTMFKDWYKKDSKNFYGFLYRLRTEGEEWEEATGQKIPDKYCKKYQ